VDADNPETQGGCRKSRNELQRIEGSAAVMHSSELTTNRSKLK